MWPTRTETMLSLVLIKDACDVIILLFICLVWLKPAQWLGVWKVAAKLYVFKPPDQLVVTPDILF